jgi:hypothetical protein
MMPLSDIFYQAAILAKMKPTHDHETSESELIFVVS